MPLNYIKLKDDRLMIITSDNYQEKTMHCYPVEKLDYDVEVDICEEIKYSDIDYISTPSGKFLQKFN